MGIKDKISGAISALKNANKTEYLLQGAISNDPTDTGSFLFNSDSKNLLAKFYACQEERVECSFDITDNFVEDNSAVHDHIGTKPLTFRLRGKIGDVAYPLNDNADSIIDSMLEARLNAETTTIQTQITTALTPILTNYMSTAMATYDFITDNVKSITGTLVKIGTMASKYDKITNILSKNKLGQMTLSKLKELNTLEKTNYTGERTNPQTPQFVLNHILNNTGVPLILVNDMGTWENVYITNAYLEQKESRYTGDVVVELKQLRYTEVKITKIDYKQYASRYAQQRADIENSGVINGKKVFASEWWKNLNGAY